MATTENGQFITVNSSADNSGNQYKFAKASGANQGTVCAAATDNVLGVIDKDYLLRSEVEKRAPGTPSKTRDHGLSTETYRCHNRSASELVTDEDRRNSDPVIDMEADATMTLAHDYLMAREIDWAASAFATGIWETDLTPSDLWDTAASTPLEDVDTAKLAIHKETGLPGRMLTGVISVEVFEAVRRHADIIAGFGGGDSRVKAADVEHLRALFGLKELHIAGAVTNTNVEGSSTQTPSFVAGKHMLLTYVPDSPGIKRPSGGYTFESEAVNISTFREQRLRSDRVEINGAFDHKVTMTTAGYMLDNLIS